MESDRHADNGRRVEDDERKVDENDEKAIPARL
jgi:hypothetical protein